MINAIKFSIEEIEASDQYFDHTGLIFGESSANPGRTRGYANRYSKVGSHLAAQASRYNVGAELDLR